MLANPKIKETAEILVVFLIIQIYSSVRGGECTSNNIVQVLFMK